MHVYMNVSTSICKKLLTVTSLNGKKALTENYIRVVYKSLQMKSNIQEKAAAEEDSNETEHRNTERRGKNPSDVKSRYRLRVSLLLYVF